MTGATPHDESRARAVDRLCEVASVGAGHAAGALATLLARPFEMSVPEARVLAPGTRTAPLATRLAADERSLGGVLFEVQGGPGGVLGFLFASSARAGMLAALLGEKADVAAQAESALSEVGNIVASHALSAMGDLLGTRVLPSPPQLADGEAPRDLARLAASATGGTPALRIEVELHDRARELRALLVWVPAPPA